MPENFSNRKILNDNLRNCLLIIFSINQNLITFKKPNQFSDLPIKINYAKTQLIDIYPTIKKFSGQKLIKKDNNMMSLLEPIPDDRIIKILLDINKEKVLIIPGQQLKKKREDLLIYSKSQKNFISKKDRLYARW